MLETASRQDSLTVMQHMQYQWQLELDWAQALREKEQSRSDP